MIDLSLALALLAVQTPGCAEFEVYLRANRPDAAAKCLPARLNSDQGASLLDATIKASSGPVGCSKSFVELLLDRGAQPLASHLISAVRSGCPETLKTLAYRARDPEIAKASRASLKLVKASLDRPKSEAGQLVLAGAALLEIADKRCRIPEKLTCEAAEGWRLLKNELAKEVGAKKLEERKVPIVQSICMLSMEIKERQDRLKREDRISRISGAVNLTLRDSLAREIVQLEDDLTDSKNEYKREIGEDFDPAEWTCSPAQ